MELVQSFWSIEHFYMFMNNSGLIAGKVFQNRGAIDFYKSPAPLDAWPD